MIKCFGTIFTYHGDSDDTGPGTGGTSGTGPNPCDGHHPVPTYGDSVRVYECVCYYLNDYEKYTNWSINPELLSPKVTYKNMSEAQYKLTYFSNGWTSFESRLRNKSR